MTPKPDGSADSVNQVTNVLSTSRVIDAAHKAMPNALGLVPFFMRLGGQSAGAFNAKQALLYLGLECEELAKQLEVIAAGEVDHSNDFAMKQCILYLKEMSRRFKDGMHLGSLLRCNLEQLLDGAHGLTVVSHGLAESISNDANASFRETMRANLAKYPGGVATRDANGKIQKPVGWTPPNLLPFVPQMDKE